MSVLRSIQKGAAKQLKSARPPSSAASGSSSSSSVSNTTERVLTPQSLLESAAARRRNAYEHPATINWYPGHQVRALQSLREDFIPRSQLILEVRDARIPLSSCNPQIESLIKERHRIIVFSKSDLLTNSERKRLLRWVQRMNDPNNLESFQRKINPNLSWKNIRTEAVLGDGRYHYIARRVADKLKLMAIDCRRWRSLPTVCCTMGFPNVGKSSLINSLRNLHGIRARSEVGKTAGVTRNICAFKISSEPLIHMLDTPGIFVPALRSEHRQDIDIGMKLGICGCLKDQSVGLIELCDYILYQCNRTGNTQRYMDLLDMTKPCYDAETVLHRVAVKYELCTVHSHSGTMGNALDLHKAAELFIDWFREGRLLRVILDDLGDDHEYSN